MKSPRPILSLSLVLLVGTALAVSAPKSDRELRRLMLKAKSVKVSYYDGLRSLSFGDVRPIELKPTVSKIRSSSHVSSAYNTEVPEFGLYLDFGASSDFSIYVSIASRAVPGADGCIMFENSSGPRDRVETYYLSDNASKAFRDFIYKRFDVAKLTKRKKS